MEEASRLAVEHGCNGLFFYTDTDCNVGFYDHLGAECVGYKDTVCNGMPLRVFGYALAVPVAR